MYTHGHHGERSLQVSREHPASEEQVRVLVLPPGVSDQELKLRGKNLSCSLKADERRCVPLSCSSAPLLFILCVYTGRRAGHRANERDERKKEKEYVMLFIVTGVDDRWLSHDQRDLSGASDEPWHVGRREEMCVISREKTKLVYPECQTIVWSVTQNI